MPIGDGANENEANREEGGDDPAIWDDLIGCEGTARTAWQGLPMTQAEHRGPLDLEYICSMNVLK
ncbi:hypothetical protein N7451_005777 [Penicillium sp. IBT 35674x]|nr:hypothetical protein N7451_005777 [Penicillium sp. IBT 35674x]